MDCPSDLSLDDLETLARAAAAAISPPYRPMAHSRSDVCATLRTLDLTDEQADAVIAYAIEHGLLQEAQRASGVFLWGKAARE